MKAWYTSKTIWFNTFVASMLNFESNLVFVKMVLGENWFGILSIIVPIINIWLRAITTKGVKLNAKD